MIHRYWWHKEAQTEVSTLGGYDVIYADCPWKYRNQGGRGAADKQYKTMSLAELCLLPVEQLASENSVLFMWGVFPMMFEAGALMKAWGYEYLNCGFIWVKTNPVAPTPFVGMGHWTRGNAEFCLMGKRGKPQRVDAAVQQIVEDNLIVSSIGDHSEKPAEVRNRISRLMGSETSKLELFSRDVISGWDRWGNDPQAPSNVVLLPEGARHEEVGVQRQEAAALVASNVGPRDDRAGAPQ